MKALLEIDPNNSAEDKKLSFFLEQSANIIEEILGRPGFSYKQRSEYYAGTGTQKLLLRSRPAYYSSPNQLITVSVDPGGFFGSVSGSFSATTTVLTFGVDFCLYIDQDDGISSRSGILVRMNDIWFKPTVRNAGLLYPHVGEDFGSILVQYWGGYLVDNLPAGFRFASDLLISRMRYLMPLGLPLSSEGWEERSISIMGEKKDYLFALVKDLIWPYRNWKW